MASYKIQGPDGYIYSFDGPDGAPESEQIRYAQELQRQRLEGIKPAATFGEALKGGAKRTLNALGTGVSGVFDPESAAQAGLAREQEITEGPGTSLDAVNERYRTEGLFSAAKEVVGQIPTALAEYAPQAGLSIAGARTGAALGSFVTPVIGSVLGGIAGAVIPNYLQAAGSNLQRQAQEEKPIDAAIAYATALPQAALDTLVDRIGLGRFLGIPTGAMGTKQAEAIAARGLTRTIAGGTAKTTLAEIPTEVTQQMLERYQAGLPLTDESARREYAAAAYQAGLTGPVGAVGALSERSKARDIVREDEELTERVNREAGAQALTQQEQADQLRAAEGNLFEMVGPAAPPAPPTPSLSDLFRTKEGVQQVINNPDQFIPGYADYDKDARKTLKTDLLGLRNRTPSAEIVAREARQTELETAFRPDEFTITDGTLDEWGISGRATAIRTRLLNAADLTKPNNRQLAINTLEDYLQTPAKRTPQQIAAVQDGIRRLQDLGTRVNEGGQFAMFPNVATDEDDPYSGVLYGSEPDTTDDTEPTVVPNPRQRKLIDTLGRPVTPRQPTKVDEAPSLASEPPDLSQPRPPINERWEALSPAAKETLRKMGFEPVPDNQESGDGVQQTSANTAEGDLRATPDGSGVVGRVEQPVPQPTTPDGTVTPTDEQGLGLPERPVSGPAGGLGAGKTGKPDTVTPIVEAPSEAWANMVDDPEVSYDALPPQIRSEWEVAQENGMANGVLADQLVARAKREIRAARASEQARRAKEAEDAIPLADETGATPTNATVAEATNPPDESALVAKLNDLIAQYNAGSRQVKTSLKPQIDAIRQQLQRIVGERLVADKTRIIDAGAKRVESEAAEYKKLPKGTRLRPSEFPEARGIYWEKTGYDEWTGRGDWFQQGKTRTSDKLAKEGGLVQVQPPASPFDADGVNIGPSVPPRVAGVARGFKRLLGIKSQIYIVSGDDVNQLLASDNDDLRSLAKYLAGEIKRAPTSVGFAATSGEHKIIWTRSGRGIAAVIETLAHELGHILQKESFDNADPETKAAVMAAYNNWKQANAGGDKPIRKLMETARLPIAMRNMTRNLPPETFNLPQSKVRQTQYYLSFNEWFADQVGRWALSNKAPQGVVEQFFSRLGKIMRQFYQTAMGRKYLPTKTMVSYLNGLVKASGNNQPITQDTSGTPQVDAQQGNIDPVAAVDADAVLAKLNNMYAQSASQPATSTLGTMQRVYRDAVDNPASVFNMSGRFFRNVRTYGAWRGSTVADQLQDAFRGAYKDQEGKLRPDFLLSQAEQEMNITEAVLRDGGLTLTAGGQIQSLPSKYKMDNVFIHAKNLADRIGQDRARELITKVFYAWRASALKQDPTNEIKNLPTDAEIRVALDVMNRTPELRAIKEEFTGAKNQMVQFLADTGFFTPEKAKQYLADDSYFPWFRIKEYETGAAGLGNAGRSVDLAQMKKLKGGDSEVNDMLENMTQIIAWMSRSGTRNYVANQSLEALSKLGGAKASRGVPPNTNPDSILSTFKGGKRLFWTVDNPMAVLAFVSVPGSASVAVDIASRFTGLLRSSVTLLPSFPISQLIQDSARIYTNSGLQEPGKAVLRSLRNFVSGTAYRANNATAEELRRFGIAAAIDTDLRDPTRGRAKKFGLSDGSKDTWTDRWLNSAAYKALHQFSYSADLAVRMAIYDQTVAETGDRDLAAVRAREIINFQRPGASGAINTAKRLIPFLGAYMQGTDVLYRAAIGRGNSMREQRVARAAFWKNVSQLAAMTVVYTMAVSGSDEYEEQRGYVTNRNFIIPGTDLKVPTAPDVGLLFKVIPEMLTDFILSEGTENPESTKRALRSFWESALQGLAPPTAVTGVVPALELATNYSFFSNMPIVGRAQESWEPSQQYVASTTELAKAIGSTFNWSPMKVDHLLRAIGGTSAGALTSLAESVLVPGKVAPDQLPVITPFTRKSVGGRFIEDYYQLREMTDRAYSTIKELQNRGDLEGAEAYMAREDVQQRLAVRPAVEQIEQFLAQVSVMRKQIENNPAMSSSEKREAINALQQQVEDTLRDAGIQRMRRQANA